jgi:hypothetical protein
LEYLGLHNKPKAEVYPGHKLTGPKDEEEEKEKPRLYQSCSAEEEAEVVSPERLKVELDHS